MMTLRGAQKKYLRGLGNGLKSVIHIGRAGLSDNLIKATDEALETHELIKVRFLEYERDERKQLTEELSRLLDAPVADTIGNTALFYRRQEDPAERKINLPA